MKVEKLDLYGIDIYVLGDAPQLRVKSNRLVDKPLYPEAVGFRPLDIYDLGLHTITGFMSFWTRLTELFYDVEFLRPDNENELSLFVDNFGDNNGLSINISRVSDGVKTMTGEVLPWSSLLAEDLYYSRGNRLSKFSKDFILSNVLGYLQSSARLYGFQPKVEGGSLELWIGGTVGKEKVAEFNLKTGYSTIFVFKHPDALMGIFRG